MVEKDKEPENKHNKLKRVALGVASLSFGISVGAFTLGSYMKMAAAAAAHSAATKATSTIHSMGIILPKQNVTYVIGQVHLTSHDPAFKISLGHNVTQASFLNTPNTALQAVEIAAVCAFLGIVAAREFIAVRRHDQAEKMQESVSAPLGRLRIM